MEVNKMNMSIEDAAANWYALMGHYGFLFTVDEYLSYLRVYRMVASLDETQANVVLKKLTSILGERLDGFPESFPIP